MHGSVLFGHAPYNGSSGTLPSPAFDAVEDPLLPEPPYVFLIRTPINCVPCQAATSSWSAPSPRPWSRRPACPSVPGSSTSSSSQAHLTASAPFQAGPRGPVSGRLSATTSRRGLAQPVAVSRCLSATGIRFSAIRFPPRDWALLTVGLPTQGVGPRRGYRVPHARATTGEGAPSTPRTTVLILPGVALRPASAASQRPVLAPRHNHPSMRGSALRGINQGFTRVRPSGLPLA